MRLFHPFLPLHPLQPGAMRGDGAAGLKKQILSSNARDAWTRDVSATDILARDMSIHEGRKLLENEELSWPEDLNPRSVGKKRLPPYSPILCPASFACGWSDYSVHESARNAEFRYLLLEAEMKA